MQLSMTTGSLSADKVEERDLNDLRVVVRGQHWETGGGCWDSNVPPHEDGEDFGTVVSVVRKPCAAVRCSDCPTRLNRKLTSLRHLGFVCQQFHAMCLALRLPVTMMEMCEYRRKTMTLIAQPRHDSRLLPLVIIFSFNRMPKI